MSDKEDYVSRLTETTRSVGVGPISLDCDMARGGGWSQDMLEEAEAEITALSRRLAERAARMHPTWYRREPDGTVVLLRPAEREASR